MSLINVSLSLKKSPPREQQNPRNQVPRRQTQEQTLDCDYVPDRRPLLKLAGRQPAAPAPGADITRDPSGHVCSLYLLLVSLLLVGYGRKKPFFRYFHPVRAFLCPRQVTKYVWRRGILS